VVLSFFVPSSHLFLGQHPIRGATKEKSSKLDELKAKRKAKDERRVRVSSSVRGGPLTII
jgi:hypothetical protein